MAIIIGDIFECNEGEITTVPVEFETAFNEPVIPTFITYTLIKDNFIVNGKQDISITPAQKTKIVLKGKDLNPGINYILIECMYPDSLPLKAFKYFRIYPLPLEV